MRVVKLHRYGVRTYPLREGRTRPRSAGKPRLEIAKPLDVTNEIWGPQELLIGSLASCFELTAHTRTEVDVRSVSNRGDQPWPQATNTPSTKRIDTPY